MAPRPRVLGWTAVGYALGWAFAHRHTYVWYLVVGKHLLEGRDAPVALAAANALVELVPPLAYLVAGAGILRGKSWGKKFLAWAAGGGAAVVAAYYAIFLGLFLETRSPFAIAWGFALKETLHLTFFYAAWRSVRRTRPRLVRAA